MKTFKITVLDGFMATRDDLNWDALNAFGQVQAYPRTSPQDIVKRAFDADIVLSNKVPMFEEQLCQLPNLKYIGVLATGYNNVDLNAAKSRSITVTNIPSYGTDSVAQTVFAHILNIANKIEEHSIAVHVGAWTKSVDICFCLSALTELSGRTLGIIGYGAIGRKVAKIAKAFDMNILAYAPSKGTSGSDGIAEFASIDDIFKRSHIISLNCPLNSDTNKIINSRNIDKCMDGVWIINTGRGGLIDEPALADALKSGKVGAAGVDVLSQEPPPADNPLLSAPNCHISPHNAWTTKEARARLISIASNNIKKWIEGSPINVL